MLLLRLFDTMDEHTPDVEASNAVPSSQHALGHLAKRSEEHTSELQSRPHLVCRLLLEKKNYVNTVITRPMACRQPFSGNRLRCTRSKTGGPDYLLRLDEPTFVTERTESKRLASVTLSC